METVVLKVDAANPEPDAIRRAADVIRTGGLVGFPTETVYGLGANALDAAAVARIFEAKGRPATNPVIVHVADASEVSNVAATWPETAAQLAARFWPGPLTLVVAKSDRVPVIVTAGGPTVAVRCPNHAVARALIRAAGVPIAAPSANRSTELSPTRAEHVLKGLNGRIDLLLDGGACPGGIESTVVDVTGEIPRVLRPGLITVPRLEEVCGRVESGATGAGVSRSPGQMAKHYSPRNPLVVVEAHKFTDACLDAACLHGWVQGLHFMDEMRSNGHPGSGGVVSLQGLSSDPQRASSLLYTILHELERSPSSPVVVALPPDTPEWAAVRDRLTRAAAES